MKISIFSDLHFGCNSNSKLENDSFDNAEEAVEKSLQSDLILIAGDIFDNRFPKPDVWAKVLKILSKPTMQEDSGIKLIEPINKNMDKISERALKGIPVLALHGTHERLGKDHNAIEALELTGFVFHLHMNGLVFEKNGIKVAIQGMSGVPERYAKQVMDRWNPQPIKDCYNILMLHQSIDPYVYSPLEPPSLNTSNLPQGFDLIVNGHIHSSTVDKVGKTNILLTGSTIVTQLKKEEAINPKGIHNLYLPENKFDFVPLDNTRRFFYEEIVEDEKKTFPDQIRRKLNSILQNNYKKIPIVRFKIKGKRFDVVDRELKKINDEYENKIILKFVKEIESEDIANKIELLKKMRSDENIPIEELGLKVMNEILSEMKFSKHFDANYVFGLLSEGQVDKTLDILTGDQNTLTSFTR